MPQQRDRTDTEMSEKMLSYLQESQHEDGVELSVHTGVPSKKAGGSSSAEALSRGFFGGEAKPVRPVAPPPSSRELGQRSRPPVVDEEQQRLVREPSWAASRLPNATRRSLLACMSALALLVAVAALVLTIVAMHPHGSLDASIMPLGQLAPPARSGNILAAEPQPPLTPEPLQTMHEHIGHAEAEMPSPLQGHDVNVT